jgi:cobalt-precorrin-5B (C1)-methyltransferase
MWPESGESSQPLRNGLTTGTCATACCIAATERLFAGNTVDEVTVTLPKGKQVSVTIDACEDVGDAVRAATIKDAGDDPDVTHGARVFVELRKSDIAGVNFHAAEGVGSVTRAGLALAVGEPAINQVPRQMMREHLQRQALRYGYEQGFDVSVGVENGAALAQKTMNPRLGIIGGLSILGTSGIVRPYSCAAWIASIHQGIDVARANGVTHIAASTGNSSEAAIQQHYDLDEIALIEMGDFAGAVFKHLKKTPLTRLSICGGFGKISKLAGRNMDLNSRASSIDFKYLARIAVEQGGSARLAEQIVGANTSIEAFGLSKADGVDIVSAICAEARDFARDVAGEHTDIEVWAIDRQGEFVGHAGFVQ